MAASGVTTAAFVGVDSGGTRTNVYAQIPDADGPPRIKPYESPQALSGALPDDLIPDVMRRILTPLERHLDAASEEPVYVWISAAGYTPWTRDAYFTALQEIVPSLLGGRIKVVGAANDTVSLLLGSRADCAIVAGTGSNVVLHGADGAIHQAGGHEWVACDYGSGFWIGLRGIRAAYRDFEDGFDTELLQRLRSQFGLRESEDDRLIARIRQLAVADEDMKKEIARFAFDVCELAGRGIESAQNLVKEEAESLADVTAAAIRRYRGGLMHEGIRLVECGSVLANEFYRTAYDAQLHRRLLGEDGSATNLDIECVRTVGDACLALATDLPAKASEYLDIDPLFRPTIAPF